jgi:hypothetical protein
MRLTHQLLSLAGLAVMMSANFSLDHFPPTNWICYTAAGANAASNSNLALGSAGADAVTGYIRDFGGNNFEVGHRRWLLYPQTQVMAAGDVPSQGACYAANTTWVFDANLFGPRPATRQPYVAWPPAGYVPFQVVFPQWSFALSNADLSMAAVSMTSNGVSVAVAIQPYQAGYGENALVWVPMGLDFTSDLAVFPFNGTDTVYRVTITNIHAGGSMTGFNYTVTVFDPSAPGVDYVAPAIGGPAQPYVNWTNIRRVKPPSLSARPPWPTAPARQPACASNLDDEHDRHAHDQWRRQLSLCGHRATRQRILPRPRAITVTRCRQSRRPSS